MDLCVWLHVRSIDASYCYLIIIPSGNGFVWSIVRWHEILPRLRTVLTYFCLRKLFPWIWIDINVDNSLTNIAASQPQRRTVDICVAGRGWVEDGWAYHAITCSQLHMSRRARPRASLRHSMIQAETEESGRCLSQQLGDCISRLSTSA